MKSAAETTRIEMISCWNASWIKNGMNAVFTSLMKLFAVPAGIYAPESVLRANAWDALNSARAAAPATAAHFTALLLIVSNMDGGG